MSTAVDTTGIKVGDPEPWPLSWWVDGHAWADDGGLMCLNEDDHYVCSAPTGHVGPHVASGGATVFHVWDAA